MKGQSFRNVDDVRRWHLCVGCGACSSICPAGNIDLVNVLSEGFRPFLRDSKECGSCQDCLAVCPSVETNFAEHRLRPGVDPSLLPTIGPVLEAWEGHAADSEIRFMGSSGGALTALALYCLEKEGMNGVLHVGQDPADPLQNKTTYSRSRAELLSKTGSRYAPASVCDGLRDLDQHAGSSVIIGQPSEIVAVRKAARLRPGLAEKIGVTLSFFCAGSPATLGTIKLLERQEIPPASVTNLRYRGRGWPGNFAVWVKGKDQPVFETTYAESWKFVQAYRPWSTHIWPDGAGEDADISCGDPWYREVQPGENGSSLVIARTERGRQIVRGALAAGYLSAQPIEHFKLIKSQENLVRKKAAVWGRLLAMRMLRLPIPKFVGAVHQRLWWSLGFSEKIRSTIGTVRRLIKKGLIKPLPQAAKNPPLEQPVLHTS